MKTERTGGEALVRGLLSHGIDTIFGLPGVQVDFFYNAVYDAGDQIRAIHSRHEQGAAYMALGYALASGKTGVYVVVPGPGFLNTRPPHCPPPTPQMRPCSAWPVRSIRTSSAAGYGMLHEIPDQLAVMHSLTKWTRRVETPGEIPRLLAEALSEMRSGRPRPVGLEAPLDVLADKAEFDDSPFPVTVRRPTVDAEAVEEAARLMGKARNPVIFVGSGAMDAGEEVRALAEALQAPVVASARGRGILSSRHPFSHTYGVGERLWEEADLVIAIGTRITKPLIQWKGQDDMALIRIDIAAEESDLISPGGCDGRGRQQGSPVTPCCQSWHVTTGRGLRAWLKWLRCARRWKRTLTRSNRRRTLFALFATRCRMTASLWMRSRRSAMPAFWQCPFTSRVHSLPPIIQATLGWGLPTALGAKVAAPDRAVLSISGDGGFLFLRRRTGDGGAAWH